MSSEKQRNLAFLLGEMQSQRAQSSDKVLVAVLNDVAGLLDEMLAVQKSTIPEGLSLPFTVTVTTTPLILDMVKTPQYRLPWISCTLFNDGAADVYQTANAAYLQTSTPLRKDETLGIDMKTKQITRLALITLSGTASLRIFAQK